MLQYESGPIWLAYVAAVLISVFISSVTIYTWQTPRDRSLFVTSIAVISLAALLATVLLLPVDIAIISSTTDNALGVKKKWATPKRVDEIVNTLHIVYYTMYSLDALLCLIVIPFGYFWYEEYDEFEIEEGRPLRSRIWATFKHTLGFVLLVAILLVLGYFLPSTTELHNRHISAIGLDKVLTFCIGAMLAIGTLLYVVYTGIGLARLPISMIRSSPSLAAPSFAAATSAALARNRSRQRQLELRNASRLSYKDRRELEHLVREERTLVRRQRLSEEAQGFRKSWIQRTFCNFAKVLKHLRLLGGLVMLAMALFMWASMLITGIDKGTNLACKGRCGYVLERLRLYQPLNAFFVWAAGFFPVDYVLLTLLVLLLFAASISGVSTIGIRFLWVRIFQVRRGHTAPQALLITTVMLAMMILAINYSLVAMIAPQYALYGTQMVCTASTANPLGCIGQPELIVPCTTIEVHQGNSVCTPSVISTFINKIIITWPLFGAIEFWSQFGFMGVFVLALFVTCVRGPRLNLSQVDEDAEEDEEERLLARSPEEYGGTWADISGRARSKNSSPSSSNAERVSQAEESRSSHV
ncbi:hypothetical protein TD95_000088 [Thielaviopsis punctulata]|uniref:Probable lysosomal cobalamin transporter n=1 Tax=Thielaviopsis punctulata TaxID=72032 RepID=A0A0F4Z6X1_9PEZI|nr:hypothetical protein TD95_000088 [Thielaviopsis punctulata]